MGTTDEVRLLTTLLARVDHIIAEQAEAKVERKETNVLLQRTCDRVAEQNTAIAVNTQRWDNHLTMHGKEWASHLEMHSRERTALGVLAAVFSAIGAGISSWFSR